MLSNKLKLFFSSLIVDLALKLHGDPSIIRISSIARFWYNWSGTTVLILLFDESLILKLFLKSIFAGFFIPSKNYSAIHTIQPQQQEFPLRCTKVKNETQTCPRDYPTSHNPSTNHSRPLNIMCPSYFRWIHEDLRPWRETGVTREMLEGARRTAHFRLVILDGKVYVEKYRESIQTRDMFTLWGILQLLRWYPGRLPDLELLFDCDDRPVVPRGRFQGPDAAPPPLFRYCSDKWSLDIVFPDWSFWGW